MYGGGTIKAYELLSICSHGVVNEPQHRQAVECFPHTADVSKIPLLPYSFLFRCKSAQQLRLFEPCYSRVEPEQYSDLTILRDVYLCQGIICAGRIGSICVLPVHTDDVSMFSFRTSARQRSFISMQKFLIGTRTSQHGRRLQLIRNCNSIPV